MRHFTHQLAGFNVGESGCALFVPLSVSLAQRPPVDVFDARVREFAISVVRPIRHDSLRLVMSSRSSWAPVQAASTKPARRRPVLTLRQTELSGSSPCTYRLTSLRGYARFQPTLCSISPRSRGVGRARLGVATSIRSWKKGARSSCFRRFLLAWEHQLRWQNASRFGKSAASSTCYSGSRNTSCSAADQAQKRSAAASTMLPLGPTALVGQLVARLPLGSSLPCSLSLEESEEMSCDKGLLPTSSLGTQAPHRPAADLDVCTPTKPTLPCPPSSARSDPARCHRPLTGLCWQRKNSGKMRHSKMGELLRSAFVKQLVNQHQVVLRSSGASVYRALVKPCATREAPTSP